MTSNTILLKDSNDAFDCNQQHSLTGAFAADLKPLLPDQLCLLKAALSRQASYNHHSDGVRGAEAEPGKIWAEAVEDGKKRPWFAKIIKSYPPHTESDAGATDLSIIGNGPGSMLEQLSVKLRDFQDQEQELPRVQERKEHLQRILSAAEQKREKLSGLIENYEKELNDLEQKLSDLTEAPENVKKTNIEIEDLKKKASLLVYKQ